MIMWKVNQNVLIKRQAMIWWLKMNEVYLKYGKEKSNI